jgi:hypothetical protein
VLLLLLLPCCCHPYPPPLSYHLALPFLHPRPGSALLLLLSLMLPAASLLPSTPPLTCRQGSALRVLRLLPPSAAGAGRGGAVAWQHPLRGPTRPLHQPLLCTQGGAVLHHDSAACAQCGCAVVLSCPALCACCVEFPCCVLCLRFCCLHAPWSSTGRANPALHMLVDPCIVSCTGTLCGNDEHGNSSL